MNDTLFDEATTQFVALSREGFKCIQFFQAIHIPSAAPTLFRLLGWGLAKLPSLQVRRTRVSLSHCNSESENKGFGKQGYRLLSSSTLTFHHSRPSLPHISKMTHFHCATPLSHFAASLHILPHLAFFFIVFPWYNAMPKKRSVCSTLPHCSEPLQMWVRGFCLLYLYFVPEDVKSCTYVIYGLTPCNVPTIWGLAHQSLPPRHIVKIRREYSSKFGITAFGFPLFSHMLGQSQATCPHKPQGPKPKIFTSLLVWRFTIFTPIWVAHGDGWKVQESSQDPWQWR